MFNIGFDCNVAAMVADMKARGIAVQSEGAWVIPVTEENDSTAGEDNEQ